ncbi:MAG: reprolysin-like metallopeptidase [Phycisphaerales bacterium]
MTRRAIPVQVRCVGIVTAAVVLMLAPGLRAQVAEPAPGGADERVSFDGLWVSSGQAPAAALAQPAWVRPAVARYARLDVGAAGATLRRAPLEGDAARGGPGPVVVAFPRPDGTFERFSVVESPIMDAQLAAQVPTVKTYAGVGLDDPRARTRFDLTPSGFHAQVFSLNDAGEPVAYYVDPISRGNTTDYASYWRGDLSEPPHRFVCETPAGDVEPFDPLSFAGQAAGVPVPRRIVQFVVAATGEYTTFVCAPAAPNALVAFGAVATAVNRVNQVFEIDLSVRLNIGFGTLNVMYTNPATDPYSGTTAQMQTQNQTNLDNVIGNADYDLGHLVHQGGNGGNAGGIGSVCNAASKGRGFTSGAAPTNDLFYIDFFAHEIGHQLGATHTFNGTGGSCAADQYTATSAYEPGSGISVMGYAGICGSNNLASVAPGGGASIPFFNFSSIEQIRAKANEAGTCLVSEVSGNSFPGVTAPNYVLPANTPFELTASGGDIDGNPVTYSWEQADRGPQLTLGPDTGQNEPLLRNFAPSPSATRLFPPLANVVSGAAIVGMNLPLLARNSTFTVVVRDNVSAGGGFARANSSVQFAASSGFRVTGPSSGSNICDGNLTVSWATAGTNAPPINCSAVNIYLSTDGGATFPHLIAAGVANNGTWSGNVPQRSLNCRVLIKGAQQPFFHVNPGTFSISSIPTLATGAQPYFTCEGLSAFIAFTTNEPANVQWYKDGALLPDATSPTLFFPAVSAGDFGNYTAVVSNNCGGFNYGPFQLGQAGPIQVFGENEFFDICESGGGTVGVSSSGFPRSFQWFKNGQAIPGANGSGYFIGTLNAAVDGDVYFCRVFNNCNSVDSPTYTARISVRLVDFVTFPTDTQTCIGGSATFTCSTTPPAILYRWYRDLALEPFASTTVPTVTLTNVQESDVGGYIVVCTNSCSNALISQPAALTVRPADGISVSGQPRSLVSIRGTSARFNVSLSGWAPTASQWYKNGEPLVNDGHIAGATSTQLTINDADFADEGAYHVVLEGGLCGPAVSEPATLAIDCNWAPFITPSSPLARQSHAMAFDEIRGITVLFGGQAGLTTLSDTWEFDGTTWTQVATPTTPPARSYHAMAYDAVRGRTLLFGGTGTGGSLSDLWEYDGTDWYPIDTQGTGPGARTASALAHDRLRGKTVLFGGFTQVGIFQTYHGDTWELDSATGLWSEVFPDAPVPSIRAYAGMTFDFHRGVCVLLGGHEGLFNTSNETWEFDGAAWTLKDAGSVGTRFRPGMSFDSVRGTVVAFGGSSLFPLVYEWNGAAWATRGTAAPAESGAIVFDFYRNYHVLFYPVNQPVGPPLPATYLLNGNVPVLVGAPGDTTLSAGVQGLLSAAATGPGVITYQWWKDSAPLADDGRITGAATDTLTFNPTDASDAGSYQVFATSACGYASSPVFVVSVGTCPLDYNLDTVVNPDDLGDFITDYFTDPAIAGPGGYAIACPENEPPYDSGYKAAYIPGGAGQCNEPFPDNLGDFITDYFVVGC